MSKTCLRHGGSRLAQRPAGKSTHGCPSWKYQQINHPKSADCRRDSLSGGDGRGEPRPSHMRRHPRPQRQSEPSLSAVRPTATHDVCVSARGSGTLRGRICSLFVSVAAPSGRLLAEESEGATKMAHRSQAHLARLMWLPPLLQRATQSRRQGIRHVSVSPREPSGGTDMMEPKITRIDCNSRNRSHQSKPARVERRKGGRIED